MKVKSKKKIGTFTNSEGIEVAIRSMPPMLVAEITSTIPMPEFPTYTTVTASGAEQKFSHDEKSIETASEEEKALWASFKAETSARQSQLSEKLITAILVTSVDLEYDEEDYNSWLIDRKLMKLPVPEDHDEAALLFKKSTVLKNGDDIRALLDAVMALTGVSKKEVDSAKSSFQG